MLFRSYEVFDMAGLSLRNALSPVVFRFTAEQLSVVGRVYSGQVHHTSRPLPPSILAQRLLPYSHPAPPYPTCRRPRCSASL